MMEKAYGAEGANDGLYRVGRDRWLLVYGYGEDTHGGYDWRKRFSRRPSMEEIRAEIYATIDAETDARIADGMTWEGSPVHIDTELQVNLLGLLMAVQGGTASFPLEVKLGDSADGSPAMHTFADAEEFVAFVNAATVHKQAAYSAGWAAKSAVDWSRYSVTS